MQASSLEVPLLERLRFCAIYTSNLDEFFMVRAGSLHDRSLLSPQPIDDKTGMNAAEQLKELYLTVHMQYPIRDRIFHKLSCDMAEKKIIYPKWSKLDKNEKNKVENFFDTEIVPVLRPYMLDAGHPFPHLENKQLHILLCLKIRAGEKRGEYVLVVGGAEEGENPLNALSVPEHIAHYTAQGMSEKDALKAAAKDRGVSKSELYKFTLKDR